MPLIIGVTAGGVLVPVRVDANGVVEISGSVDLLAGTNNIGDVDVLTLPALPTGTNEIGKIQARNYGLVGGLFQKDPIRLGYSSRVRRTWSDTSLDAGDNEVNNSVVPADEIWIIPSFSFRYVGTVPTKVRWQIKAGGTDYQIKDQLSPASGRVYHVRGPWVLSEDDVLSLKVFGATANDDLYGYAWGHRVDIAE